MNSLHDCTALITGASSGIGAEIARQLGPKAKRLVLVARREDRLQALAKKLERPGLEVYCLSADLQKLEDIEAILSDLKSRNIEIDFLVNNAGLGDHGFFENSDWKRIEAMLAVNIVALTRMTHGLLPGIVRSKGAILNISSVVSYLPLPGMAIYAATKAFVTSFSEGIRGELHKAGVTVTTVCPGPVNTEFSDVATRPNEHDEHIAPEVLKVPVEQVAEEALRAVAKNQAKMVPGGLMSGLMFLTSLVPFGMIRPLFYKKR